MSNQNYGPNPFEAPAPQPAPKKQKRFGFLALGIATASALIVGSCTGALAGGGDSTTTAEPAPTVTVTAPAEPGSTVTVTAKPEPAPTVTVTATPEPKEAEQEEAEPEEPVLGDGLWEVGVDIKAGRYKTTVPADSYNCYVARHKDDSGEFESIIANENYEPGARVSVKVKKGEWLELKGCGDAWKRVK